MPYFLVTDFRGGLDVRRSPWTSEAGTLQALENGHITRGGEIEKRKEFSNLGDLLDGTFALIAGRDADNNPRGLMVFGSDPAPSGLPAGVTYQRLVHPDADADMTEVIASVLYDGKPYVVALFDDGTRWHYYDGQLVTDWGAGTVRISMTSNAAIAEHLRALIDADASYTATRSGAQITITGEEGVDYDIEVETENVAGGVDDQTLSYTLLTAPVTEVATARAFAEFAIISGTDDDGVANFINAIRVDVSGVFTDLITANVNFDTSPELTALAVATAINAGTGTHGYTAESQYGRVFITASAALGSTANGRILEVTAKGDVVLYEGGFMISYGTSSPGVNMITSVLANGVEILGANVDWTTDNAATASLVAAQIRAYASVPKYNAIAEGENIFVSPEKIRSNNATTITLKAEAVGTVSFTQSSAPAVRDQYPDYGFDYYEYINNNSELV